MILKSIAEVERISVTLEDTDGYSYTRDGTLIYLVISGNGNAQVLIKMNAVQCGRVVGGLLAALEEVRIAQPESFEPSQKDR